MQILTEKLSKSKRKVNSTSLPILDKCTIPLHLPYRRGKSTLSFLATLKTTFSKIQERSCSEVKWLNRGPKICLIVFPIWICVPSVHILTRKQDRNIETSSITSAFPRTKTKKERKKEKRNYIVYTCSLCQMFCFPNRQIEPSSPDNKGNCKRKTMDKVTATKKPTFQ